MKKLIALAALLLVTACTAQPNNVDKQSTGENMRIYSTNESNIQSIPSNQTSASSITYPYGQPDTSLSMKQTANNFPNWFIGDRFFTGRTDYPNYNNGTANPQYPAAPNDGGNAAQGQNADQFAQEVLNLVNSQRQNAGLNPLSMDAKLANMAMVKAKDMYDNNYFAHNSPTYGSPFDMMRQFGITYQYAGENIAKGQTSPQQVMNDWMNSPGHKANILKSAFTKIGVAYYRGEWVQEFIG